MVERSYDQEPAGHCSSKSWYSEVETLCKQLCYNLANSICPFNSDKYISIDQSFVPEYTRCQPLSCLLRTVSRTRQSVSNMESLHLLLYACIKSETIRHGKSCSRKTSHQRWHKCNKEDSLSLSVQRKYAVFNLPVD
jgi:hypothetical protein